MKQSYKIFAMAAALLLALAGCQKEKPLPFYQNGKAVALTSSTTTIAPTATDSLTTALVLNWTNPGYATDSSTYKYIIQIDSSGAGFSHPDQIVVTGRRNDSLIAKDLNSLLIARGYQFGKAYKMDVRVVSSYANNNERYTSNVLTLTMTPYVVPPKVALPTTGQLFLVGDATQGGWTNPVPVPFQQFEQIDSVTYGGIFQLNATGQYLILPKNGDWTQKYAVSDNTVAGAASGGDFGYYSDALGNSGSGQNIPGPGAAGLYKIMVDFQHGKYTVTPYTRTLPDSLFITGDATAAGWANPVPRATQLFTRLNSAEFSLTLSLNAGGQYLLLPVNGSWDHKFSVDDNTVAGLWKGGAFGYDLSSNFPGPADAGTYKIMVSFLDYTFKVTPQ